MTKFASRVAKIKTKLTQTFGRLIQDERGQSTTEYILILSIVVMVAMKFKGALQGKIEQSTNQVFSGIDGVISNSTNGN
jgi:hypothetical protein